MNSRVRALIEKAGESLEAADYGTSERVAAEEAEEHIQHAAEFLAVVAQLLEPGEH